MANSNNKFEFKNGLVLFDKSIIGRYSRTMQGTFRVQDVRGKQAEYKLEGEMCWHFMSFTGWKEYAHTFPRVRPRAGLVTKNKEQRKRFALT